MSKTFYNEKAAAEWLGITHHAMMRTVKNMKIDGVFKKMVIKGNSSSQGWRISMYTIQQLEAIKKYRAIPKVRKHKKRNQD